MRLSSNAKISFICLFVLSLFIISGYSSEASYYQSSSIWSFPNNCYLDFNQAINFTDVPSQGIPSDNNLVGYWNMNEGSGAVASDLGGNSNNGVITGTTWIAGKYGEALSFNGKTDYVNCSDKAAFEFSVEDNFTISLWFKTTFNGKWTPTDPVGLQGIITKGYETSIKKHLGIC